MRETTIKIPGELNARLAAIAKAKRPPFSTKLFVNLELEKLAARHEAKKGGAK